MAVPFDGGVSLVLASVISAGIIPANIATCEHPFSMPFLENHTSHKIKASIVHTLNDGTIKTYAGTQAQKDAYDKLERSIRDVKSDFEQAPNNRLKKKLVKKAQKLEDMKQWIVDGLKEEIDGKPKNDEDVKFEVVKGRSPKARKKKAALN